MSDIKEQLKEVWCAGNRTSSVYFESKEDAESYACSGGATAGIEVFSIDIIPSSKARQEPSTADTIDKLKEQILDLVNECDDRDYGMCNVSLDEGLDKLLAHLQHKEQE